VRQQDVLSAWSGIRPLAADPSKGDTQNIVRDHVIFQDQDGLLTITGGKWTTYRCARQGTLFCVYDYVCSSDRLFCICQVDGRGVL
jgi:glycerol-3-phosphate dehydrogenase